MSTIARMKNPPLLKSPAPLIDSHAHLDFDRFDTDRDEVLARATAAGVSKIITIGTDLARSRAARDLAEQYPQVWAAAGVHPHNAAAFDDADWPSLRALYDHPKVVAVGETGLDYYYDFSPPARQQALFRTHLEVAAEMGLPVVVHIRDAFDDAFAIVEAVGLPAGGVVHCFTGGVEDCARAVALGFHISLSGIATFKGAKALRAAIPTIPADRLLLETDAPYLAPTPHRGDRNEPAYVVHTAAEVARLRSESMAALCALSVGNTERVFGLC